MKEYSSYLFNLIQEIQARGGGMVLSLDGKPEAVVLSIEKYNQILQSQSFSLTHPQNMEHQTDTSLNILVTGGAGYIGGHVTHLLKSQGFNPIVLDDFRTGRKDHIPAGVKLVEGNVSNLELLTQVFAENSISAVIHLAALLEVEESVYKPLEYFENNAGATYILLQAMEQAGCKNIIFSSTAAVYGNQEQIPISEEAVPDPNNPYGESKLLAENILKYFSHNLGFNVTVLRYFNVAGCELEYKVKDTHRNSHLIPIVLDSITGKNSVFKIHGSDYATFDGSCVRDFIHVQDVARAHVVCLKELQSGFRIYNIGTGKGFSVKEVIQAATEITGKMIASEVGPRRKGDSAITVADVSKIHRELGFRPNFSTLENIIQASWQMLKNESK